jgi:hypothetical protein
MYACENIVTYIYLHTHIFLCADIATAIAAAAAKNTHLCSSVVVQSTGFDSSCGSILDNCMDLNQSFNISSNLSLKYVHASYHTDLH